MNRLGASYFESMYAKGPDPWGFDSRWYEARKYAITMASLPRKRYACAFEPGCANGALTVQLAARCDRVIAAEMMPEVAARARTRTKGSPHVEILDLAIPDAWPEATFDLIVLSEVVYYLTEAGVRQLFARIDASLAPGGHVVAVHWTGTTNYPLSGHETHDLLDRHATWAPLVAHRDTEFLLSVYQRSGT